MNENGDVSDSERTHLDGNDVPAIRVVKKEWKWRRIWTNTTVEPVLFIAFICRVLTLGAVLTDVLLHKTCTVDLGHNASTCSELGSDTPEGRALEAEVESYTATVVMAHKLMQLVLSAFVSFFLGPWSDVNGRRPLIIWCTIGSGLTYLLLIVITYVDWIPSMYVLLAAIPGAISGGSNTLILSCFCYLSDITTESERSFRMSILEGLMYGGVLVGTFTCSHIYVAGGFYGYLIICILSAVLSAATALYVYFVLPETVTWTSGAKGLLGAADWRLLKDLVNTCFKRRESSKRAVILLTVVTLPLGVLVFEGEYNVSFLFTRVHFGWGIEEFTNWLTVILLVTTVGTIFGMFVLSNYWKISDAVVGMLFSIMMTSQSIIIALLPSSMVAGMYAIIPLNSLAALLGPIARSILSKSVSTQDVGKVFTLMASLEAFLPIAVTPLYTMVYKSTMQSSLPGTFFFISSAMYFTNFLCFGSVAAIQKHQSLKNLSSVVKTLQEVDSMHAKNALLTYTDDKSNRPSAEVLNPVPAGTMAPGDLAGATSLN